MEEKKNVENIDNKEEYINVIKEYFNSLKNDLL